jgi:PKHD-type hydroxylase
LFVIADVLSREEVLRVQEGLAHAPFQSGRLTAAAAAEKVKDNEQARSGDPTVKSLARMVRLALEAHPIVRTWARPVRWSSLMFSRYGLGQHYGMHTDNSRMHDEDGWSLRTDISFTVFLSDPDTYAGGSLVLRHLSGDREFRPQAGTAVFYPTGELHCVAPITRGQRLACVGWMQSLIRRTDQRELLHDLEQIRSDTCAGSTSLLLDKTIGNLLRMWGDD